LVESLSTNHLVEDTPVTRSLLSATLLLLFVAVLARAEDKAAENARARMEAARKVYELSWKRLSAEGGEPDYEKFYRWSQRWMEAEKELAAKKADRVAAVQGHLDRMKDMEKKVKDQLKRGFVTAAEESATVFYRLEAERWLEKVQAE
jgi:hypothetical protein